MKVMAGWSPSQAPDTAQRFYKIESPANLVGLSRLCDIG